MILRLTAILFLFAASLAARGEASPKIWRVDCDASQAESGVLHSLAEVDALTLQPGDQLLFRRGSVCHGVLAPKGSGAESKPVHIGAYGSGPRPRIEASNKDDAGVDIRDQGWLEIDALDVSGSRLYGVHVLATHGLSHHIVLRDLTVHDVGNLIDKVQTKESGLVVVHSGTPGAAFDDVTIDGILAYGTTQWAGIIVSGTTGSVPTSHVVIRNSTVHDVQGDGIVLFRVADGVIENSIAWHTGMQDKETIGTPNGIWTWACTRCTVQNNEAFLTDSPGVDGGAFDIDFWNDANSVINNYGHDTQGYCVSVFGAYSPATTASMIRDNLCVRNGLSPRLAERQGAIFFATWDGGSIDGVKVEKNTVYFDPPGQYAAIQGLTDLKARGIVFEENVIDSTSNIAAAAAIRDRYEFRNNTMTHGGFPSGLVADSAKVIPQWAKAVAGPDRSQVWRLIVALPETNGSALPRSVVGQLALLRSQAWQYGKESVEIVAACRCGDEDRKAIETDWELANAGVTLTTLGIASPNVEAAVLIDRGGKVAKSWEGPLTPTDLGLVLRRALGTPHFAGLPTGR